MALRRLKDCMEELHENQVSNVACATTPANPNCQASKQYVKWEEVRDFLLMAEEALRAKDRAAQRAIDEAHNLGSSEEVEFLLSEMEKMGEERATLQQRVQELVRANQSLTEEVTIIRAQIEASGDAVPPSPGFSPSMRVSQEENGHQVHQLAAERARTAALENELDTLKTKMESLEMKSNEKTISTTQLPESPRISAGKNTRKKKQQK